jgi:hypothetical protein
MTSNPPASMMTVTTRPVTDTAHPCATAALLIEMITGVVITRELVGTAKFTSGSVPFPWF